VKKSPLGDARDRARVLRRDPTDAEKTLWQILRARQVDGHKFRRQVPLGRYIADFVCHDARLIGELDGGQHDASSQREAARTRFLQDQGYRVLRFWNQEVLSNREGVHERISEDLRRSPPPNPPPSRGRALISHVSFIKARQSAESG